MTGQMMDGAWFGQGIGMYLGMIFWVLLLVGIVVILVRAVQQTGGAQASGGSETALDILNKRYANGEIGKEEYEDKKSLVSQT